MNSIIKRVIENPTYVFNRIKEKYYILPKFKRLQKKSLIDFIEKTTSGNLMEYEKYINEFFSLIDIHNFAYEQYSEINMAYELDRFGWTPFLYYFIRITKPKVVVETGCFFGDSTLSILSALMVNNYGELYTIDYPAYKELGGYYDSNPYLDESKRITYLPEGKKPGFIVIHHLKDRWNFIEGKSFEKLPILLSKLGNIDMFLHDSLHSYDNMIFEFKLAYSHLRDGGFLFADNIDWNDAFNDFSKGKESFRYLAYYQSSKLKCNFGGIRKNENN